MKLIKTIPIASTSLVTAGLLLSASLGCSDDAEPAVGTGGAGAGTGGASGGSTTGGASTGGAASGGAASGGAASGGAASGGTGGTAGTGGDGTGGAAELNGDTLLGLDGKFWPIRANNGDDTGSSKYWLTASDAACPAEGHTIMEEYTGKGDAAKQYTVNFEVRGALALHCYDGGTASGMTADAAGMNEALYVGGASSGESSTSMVALTVSPDVAGAEANTYYLNGIPSSSGMCDEGITYDVKYTGSFVMMGDSTVTLSYHSADCQALANCGAEAASCTPREIDTEGIEVRASSPQPVSDVFFVDDTQVDVYPQWLIFDVTEVTEQ